MAKRSCNFFDVNNIREFVEAGNTDASVIGSRLNIQPETVQAFINTMLTRGQKAAATRAARREEQCHKHS